MMFTSRVQSESIVIQISKSKVDCGGFVNLLDMMSPTGPKP